jgi:hypothetical protein
MPSFVHVRHRLLASLFLNSNLAAIKKCIEWRLQVQIALFAEVNLALSRLDMDSRPGTYCQPAEISATIYYQNNIKIK